MRQKKRELPDVVGPLNAWLKNHGPCARDGCRCERVRTVTARAFWLLAPARPAMSLEQYLSALVAPSAAQPFLPDLMVRATEPARPLRGRPRQDEFSSAIRTLGENNGFTVPEILEMVPGTTDDQVIDIIRRKERGKSRDFSPLEARTSGPLRRRRRHAVHDRRRRHARRPIR